MMKVIGFGGNLAFGKDVSADHLAAQLNRRFKTSALWRRVGFAQAVKKIFADTFLVSQDFIEEWKRKDEIPPGFDLNVRKSLQLIGDGFRKIQSDIWVKLALRETHIPKILSDCRYINEAKFIKDNGGLTILMWRPGYENNDTCPSEAQLRPAIEWCAKSGKEGLINEWGMEIPECVKNFDFFLINNGNLQQLYNKIDATIVPWVETVYA